MEYEQQMVVQASLFLVLAFGLAFLFVRSQGKFGIVSVSEAGLEIDQNGLRCQLSWRDVRTFSKIPLMHPPVYRLTHAQSDTPTYFVPRTFWYVTTPVGVFASSSMGRFIKRRLNDHGVP